MFPFRTFSFAFAGNNHGPVDFGVAENNDPNNSTPNFNPCPVEETAIGKFVYTSDFAVLNDFLL